MGRIQTSDWLATIRAYLGVSVALHLLWEIVQLPLSTIWRTGTWREIGLAVIHCTAGDGVIATLALVAVLLVLRATRWPAERFYPVAFTTLAVGIGYTIYSEWLNTVVRKSWAYSDLMPVLPLIGTGLSPLLQWTVVPLAAFHLASLLSADAARE